MQKLHCQSSKSLFRIICFTFFFLQRHTHTRTAKTNRNEWAFQQWNHLCKHLCLLLQKQTLCAFPNTYQPRDTEMLTHTRQNLPIWKNFWLNRCHSRGKKTKPNKNVSGLAKLYWFPYFGLKVLWNATDINFLLGCQYIIIIIFHLILLSNIWPEPIQHNLNFISSIILLSPSPSSPPALDIWFEKNSSHRNSNHILTRNREW